MEESDNNNNTKKECNNLKHPLKNLIIKTKNTKLYKTIIAECKNLSDDDIFSYTWYPYKGFKSHIQNGEFIDNKKELLKHESNNEQEESQALLFNNELSYKTIESIIIS